MFVVVAVGDVTECDVANVVAVGVGGRCRLVVCLFVVAGSIPFVVVVGS